MTVRTRSFRVARTRASRGFTLLELILAMAMCAMLALSLYTAMTVTIRSRRTATAAVESIRALAIAGDLVRHDFESVLPPTGLLAGPLIGTHQAGGAGGDNDTVSFYTVGTDAPPVSATVPQSTSASLSKAFGGSTFGSLSGTEEPPLIEGIRNVEFYLAASPTDASAMNLVRRVTRNLLSSSQPLAEEEIICRNVRSFSLRYFDGTSWQESWDSTLVGDLLPTAVAITLDVADPLNPQAAPRRISRVIQMSCAEPIDSLSTTEAQ